MTLIWLVVWLLSGAPQLHRWNAWLVGLGVCLLIDLLALRRSGKL